MSDHLSADDGLPQAGGEHKERAALGVEVLDQRGNGFALVVPQPDSHRLVRSLLPQLQQVGAGPEVDALAGASQDLSARHSVSAGHERW